MRALLAPLRLLLPVLVTASACHPVAATHLVSLPSPAPTEGSVPRDARIIELRPVVDARPGKREIVGRVNPLLQASAYFNRIENIVTNDDVSGWMGGALRTELQRVGVAAVERAPDARGPVLETVVHRVFCDVDPASYYESAVAVGARIRSGDASLVDRVYESKLRIEVPYRTGPTDEGYRACLANGVQDVARKIAADAARALDAPVRAERPVQAGP